MAAGSRVAQCDMEFLHATIASYRRLLNNADMDPHSPAKYIVLHALGNAHMHLYDQLGNNSDIDAAICMLRDALVSSGETEQQICALVDLSCALCLAFEERGGIAFLNEALELGRQAVQLSSSHNSSYGCAASHQLSRTLYLLFLETSRMEHLEDCKQLSRQGLQCCTTHCDHYALALQNLGLSLYQTHVMSLYPTALDESEQILLFVLHLHPTGHPDRPGTLLALSGVARMRFNTTGDIAHIDAATRFVQGALALCPPGHRAHATALEKLGICAETRWRRTGAAADLQAALDLGRAALALRPPGHPARWYVLNSLAVATIHCVSAADMGPLFEVLAWHGEALQTYPPGHWRANDSLVNLGVALGMHHALTGDLRSLEDCIACYKQCWELLDAKHGFRHELARYIADGLHEHFQCLGNIEDLEEAISFARLSMLCGEYGVPAQRLSSLGGMLIHRFERLGIPSDLDEAIARLEAARDLADDYPCIENVFMILGDAYTLRFRQRHQELVASAACHAYDEALRRCDPKSPYSNPGLLLLKVAYIKLLHSEDLVLDDVLQKLSDGLADSRTSPRDKLFTSLPILAKLGNFGLEYFMQAPHFALRILDLYLATIRLVPEVVFLGMDLDCRLKSLLLQDSIMTNVIAYGRACNRVGHALEILEEGCSLFWNRALHLRTPLPSALQGKFEQLVGEMEHDSLAPRGRGPDRVTLLFSCTDAFSAAKRHTARHADVLKSLIAQVRSFPGFERFMLHYELSVLYEAASHGPIVVLVAGSLSCDAIILLPSRSLLTVPLPSVSKTRLQKLRGAWDDAVVHIRRTSLEERLHLVRPRIISSDESQYRVLRELWVHVVSPVFAALGLKKSAGRDRPRLWWCCTGAFACLPVHAAGNSGEFCSDYVVSSYTMNIGVLLHARRTLQRVRRFEVRVLLGAVADMSLPEATQEIREICAIIPPSSQLSLPLTEDARQPNCRDVTTSAIMENIPNAHILHLACHGTQDARDPLNSGLVLADGKLTIATLMRTPLPRAFFAFMSACDTAQGDSKIVNQNIHLGAAMLFAGFKSVVGTMWSMADADGPRVARTVYERLFEGDSEYLDPDDIPYALDEAVHLLQRHGISPGRWATYIHLGI